MAADCAALTYDSIGCASDGDTTHQLLAARLGDSKQVHFPSIEARGSSGTVLWSSALRHSTQVFGLGSGKLAPSTCPIGHLQTDEPATRHTLRSAVCRPAPDYVDCVDCELWLTVIASALRRFDRRTEQSHAFLAVLAKQRIDRGECVNYLLATRAPSDVAGARSKGGRPPLRNLVRRAHASCRRARASHLLCR